MNKLFAILLYFSFLNLVLKAQLINNNLVVISEKGKQFTLYLNDQKINSTPETIAKAFDLTEGWQKIKIEFADEKNTSLTDSIRIRAFEKNSEKELTYVIREEEKSNGTKYKLVFITEGDRSGPKTPRVPEAPKYVIVVDNNLYGNLYKAKENKPNFFQNYSEEKKECVVSLNDTEIQYAINLFNKTNDKADRITYLETIIQYNCYTTEQLIQILNLFDIEMDKLKQARIAYWHLSDKNNVSKINEIFKFPTFKEEFNVFLKEVADKNKQENLKCTVPISDTQFNFIYNSVNKAKNEFAKLEVAKKETVMNCFSTAQIKKIMNIFVHDREKMDFIYAAYSVVTDKENYPTLANDIQFNENKNDFLKFISK